LDKLEEGARLLDAYRDACIHQRNLYALAGVQSVTGICEVLRGNVGRGLHLIENAIVTEEKKRGVQDWSGLVPVPLSGSVFGNHREK
jgi:hypothetical protein